MKHYLAKFYNEALPLKAILCGAAALFYVAICAFGGAGPWGMALFALAVLAYIWLPGRMAAQIVGARKLFPAMELPLAILLGTGIFAACYCVSMRVGALALVVRNLPLALSVLYICTHFIRKDKRLSLPGKPSPQLQLAGLLFFILLALYTFAGAIKYAHPAVVGDSILSQDFLWNVGNARSFALRFIPEDIRYSGVQLHYHYLTELLAGALSLVTGLSCYNILGFYMAPYILAAQLCSMYCFGKLFLGSERKTLFFMFAPFLLACASLWGCFLNGRSVFFNDSAQHMITNINSQATAILYLCIFAGVHITLLDKGFRPGLREMAFLLAAFFMLCFAKGPVAAIVAVAACITLIWVFIQRKAGWQAPVTAILVGGMFYIVYTRFFSAGANTSMLFSASATLSKTVFSAGLGVLWQWNLPVWRMALPLAALAHTFCMAPAQCTLYLHGLWADIRGLFHLPGRRLFAHAVAVGGMAAFYLFDHPSLSQVYFAYLGLFFIGLLGADALDRPFSSAGKVCIRGAVALGLATTVFMYGNFAGSGLRALLRNTGVVEKYPYVSTVKAEDETAMAWLEANSDKTALFVTNRIHSMFPGKLAGDGISSLYSAFSGRQGYMEGYAYALTNMGVPYYVVAQRRAVVDALFSPDTSSEEVDRICREAGITHIVFSAQFSGSENVLAALYPLVYEEGTVRIYATGAAPLSPHPLYQPAFENYAAVPPGEPG